MGFVVLAAPLTVLLGAGAAAAEPPLQVVDRITDPVGALAPETAPAADQSLQELSAEAGIDLYAVFVRSFDTPPDQDWAEETARMSGLTGADMLLAVAVGDETYEYRWWLGDSFPLSAVDVEQIIATKVEPAMTADDWAGGVTALAQDLRSVTAPTPETDSDTNTDREDSDALLWTGRTTVAIAAGLFGVLLVAHVLSRRGRIAASSR